GVPILPPTSVENFPAATISPASEVVVVLPLAPVMAMIGPGRNCAASSISPMITTGSPRLRACVSCGASTGTPGLTTIKSCPRKVRSPWPPVSTVMPCSSRSRISSRSSASGLESDTVTRAPRDFRKSAEATPDLPRPTTSTRLLFRSIKFFSPRRHGDTEKKQTRCWSPPCLRASVVHSLSQFQRGQRKQRKYQRCNPEAHNHFRFRPAQQFEVMVNRRHLENAFLAQLVGTNLQNHRE